MLARDRTGQAGPPPGMVVADVAPMDVVHAAGAGKVVMMLVVVVMPDVAVGSDDRILPRHALIQTATSWVKMLELPLSRRLHFLGLVSVAPRGRQAIRAEVVCVGEKKGSMVSVVEPLLAREMRRSMTRAKRMTWARDSRWRQPECGSQDLTPSW